VPGEGEHLEEQKPEDRPSKAEEQSPEAKGEDPEAGELLQRKREEALDVRRRTMGERKEEEVIQQIEEGKMKSHR